MSSKYSKWLMVWALAGTIGSLSGCGGGGGTQVASSTPTTTTTTAPTPQSTPTPEEKTEPPKVQASYGSETTSANNSAPGGSSGGSSGGSGGSRSMGAITEESDSGDGSGMSSGRSGPPANYPAAAGTGMTPGMGMTTGSGMTGATRGSRAPGGGGGSMSMTSGYGSEGMSGFDGSGPGGQAEGDFGMVASFLQQNCINCHGSGNAKGGVRLDRIHQEISADSQAWLGVVEQLEAGSMPPRTAQQPDPRRKALVIEFIRDALGNAPEASFIERAEVAFRKGELDKATQLFYAQVVTADESEVAELANHFKLYRPVVTKPEDLTPTNEFGTAVKPRLTTQLPLAVGIVLKLTGQITDVKPIGVNQAGGGGGGEMGSEGSGGPLRGAGRGPGAGGGGAAGTANANSKLEAFEDLTGDLGRAIVSAYEGRRSSGKYGTLFSTLTEDPTSNNFENAGMAGGSGSDDPESSGLAGMAGMGGGRGASGRGMGAGMAGGGMGMGMGGGPDAATRPAKTMPGKKLANGLTYIGKADTVNSLLKKSIEAGADGLLVLEIEASKNFRNNIVTNETRIRFLLPSGKPVANSSKTLKNIDIERAIAMGKDADDVQKQVDIVFNRLDTILNVADIPQLSAASALKQLHARVHSDADRLQVLAEARMFHAKEIISSEQLEMVYQVVLEGNEGISLAKGSSDDRKLVLASYTEKL